jgi:hypothetical protein
MINGFYFSFVNMLYIGIETDIDTKGNKQNYFIR